MTALEVRPAKVVLVPKVPERLHILSLSNSLTAFSRQDELFVDMAQSMGISAEWTAHNLISKSLSAHWEEGPLLNSDGMPGAQQLVRNYPWTHIILQDHSQLPLRNRDTFLKNIERWVEYIRRECPNPDVVIVLPMSWAYSTSWSTFFSDTESLNQSFREAAYRTASEVCPIGEAYCQVLQKEGESVAQELYIDDRHPSGLAGYMAAAMELSLMTGICPTSIQWCPDTIDASKAEMVRKVAENVLSTYDNVVDHLRNTVRFEARSTDLKDRTSDVTRFASWKAMGEGAMRGSTFIGSGQTGEAAVDAYAFKLHGGAEVKMVKYAEPKPCELPFVAITDDQTSVTEDFDGMSGGITLPVGWRVDSQPKAYCCAGDFAMALDTVSFTGGANISMDEPGWTARFESSQGGDYAVGGLATSFSGCPVGINVYARFVNTGQVPVCHFKLAYDVEKYKKGSNPVGTEVKLFYSYDGKSWVSASSFTSHWDADVFNSGEPVVPIDSRRVAHHLHGIELEPGQELYLAWNIGPSVSGTANRTMALGIDNVALSYSRRMVGLEAVEAASAMKVDGNVLMGEGRMVVYDMNGRIVAEGRQILPINKLMSGVYVAKDHAGHTLKFIR